LGDHFKSKSSIPFHASPEDSFQILTQSFGLGCDNSWMNDGLVSLKDREKKMMGSATPTDATAIKAKDEIIRLLNEVEAKTFAEVQSENSLVLN